MTVGRVFDRIVCFDERSRGFPIRALFSATSRVTKTWNCDTWLNQGEEGACVGFAVSHEAAAEPVPVPGVTNSTARDLYFRALQLDDVPGEKDEGTSVIAGVKAGAEHGWYPEYRWAFGEPDLALAVGIVGPAILGINWYEGMLNPDAGGFIHVTGNIVGGHAILVRGYDVPRDAYLLHNSWGQDWGFNGDCWISRSDMTRLLSEQGEACIPVQRAVGPVKEEYPMASATDVLRRAAAEIGYLEIPVNRTKFAAIAGHPNGAAWCQTFLCAVTKQAGVSLPPSSSSTLYTIDGFRNTGGWHTSPQRGDFAYFDFEGRASLAGVQHVGIVESVSPDGRTVVCIEGNTSRADGVNINGGGVWRRIRSRSYIVGYGRPAYTAETTPPPVPVAVDDMGVNAPPVALVACATGGYWQVCADGGVFAQGGSPFYGSMAGHALNQPIVAAAATLTGKGYWMVARDGGIFSFGDAKFFGSTGSIKLNQPIVAMTSTSTSQGYWLAAADGGIFAFGDAVFHGSTGSMKLNKPIVGMAARPQGDGYWLVGSDGGIFAFSVPFFGSTGGQTLNKPIVGMATSSTGNGYWLVASDGGIFAFGDAPFKGSTGDIKLNKPVSGMAGSPTGQGYWLYGADGGVFAFGDAPFCGGLAAG